MAFENLLVRGLAKRLDLLACCMVRDRSVSILFYQFSVGQALDRASESSPKSGSIYEITIEFNGG
ncbi:MULTISPECIES: hypothetical protein [unclassified Microcoleus]|uniref:hypothetical protein n=1 Tax=unclassified Microcoleus TaxID=2642155 RepID=UPI002FD0F47C